MYTFYVCHNSHTFSHIKKKSHLFDFEVGDKSLLKVILQMYHLLHNNKRLHCFVQRNENTEKNNTVDRNYGI